MTQRRVTVLGATGSVGSSTVDVLAGDPESFAVVAVTAQTNAAKLAEIAKRLKAKRAVVGDPSAYEDLRAALEGTGIEAAAGASALDEAAAMPTDVVLSAIVGAAGLKPTAAAVRAGHDVALANKECLVCAGEAFMDLARRHDANILPTDSEHNAIFQLIDGTDAADIGSYTLTASGGPFRTWDAEAIASATPEQALKHPTWSMGAKISIDSATLMNKGLELIEAHHLFGIAPDRLRVLVHPQSLVHAMVTFLDGSIHAELGAADMRRPIAHCLYWPRRSRTPIKSLDLSAAPSLSFEQPDPERFPALRLAQEALRRGQGAATVLNGANEVAVAAFLGHRVPFGSIARIVEETLMAADREGLLQVPASVEAALVLDGEARRLAVDVLERQ
ncbi:1-deoxy-D-xylulose 5-phosphate reductoisomerase [Faunimonas pinastri]|uniref:1-deoxy-D-xylulose 5-phosphate reductoisomerase n=1 Tax=Faunimonas pinastri TaxID=1855383 RepID=A0A1H9J6J5_9HYPH|nr:1-deoxy-D-xylulose-5-phosphate reductoisomerase [Faunimonas pinastri]SEQ82504.1 1-deoxy-D-xylulose 5-phosphate reductoisomerase [Faunimonas pinastri]